MNDQDPISQFFPDQDSVDLYQVLALTSEAKPEDIKKSYRRLALIYHPDKHATASESARADASLKFQQVGFAYAVLSDEKRRQRYDRTGKTDEGFELAAGEDGWETYFEQLFDRVTRGKLDEMKKEYQGSGEEVEDLRQAYIITNGSIGDMMTYIPHSTHDDEVRFITIVSDLIKKGELPSLPAWENSVKDEKARLVRRKQGEKEAEEAEKLAKELGVWDEFYGSGKPGQRKSKGKAAKDAEADGEDDHSALKALMLKRKEKNMDSFFDSLASKYAEPTKKGKGKKRGKATEDKDYVEESPKKGKGKKRGKATEDKDYVEESPKKKSRSAMPDPPELDDEEFAKLQQKLFGDKSKQDNSRKKTSKGRKGK